MTDPRVTELRYVGLALPGFEVERDFIGGAWGLVDVHSNGELAYLAAVGSNEPFVIRLRRAEERRLDVIGFAAADKAAVDGLHARLMGGGVQIIHGPQPLASPGGGYGFRAFDLDGRTLEISAEVATREGRDIAPGEAVPRGLSHIVLHTPSQPSACRFYEEMLGFRLSDQLGDMMYFLRCNKWHHRLAFLPGPASLNHIAFDMRGIDEVMRGLGRILNTDATLVWGPGRHTAGNNTFAYFLTPGGNNLEYTSDMDSCGDDWAATIYELTATVADQWGTGRIRPEQAPYRSAEADPGLWKAPPV